MKDREEREADQGGDPACWAQLVCSECGAIGEDHRAECSQPNADDETLRKT